jgi:hypothetical protein
MKGGREQKFSVQEIIVIWKAFVIFSFLSLSLKKL